MERDAQEVNEKLNVAKLAFEKIQNELNECKAHMNKLQEEYSILIASKKDLEEKIENKKIYLTRAEKLTSLLVDENLRWKETIKTYNEQIKYVLSDSLISASIISYLGPFDNQTRQKLINSIKEIVIVKDNLKLII